MTRIDFVFMLTRNDRTIPDALAQLPLVLSAGVRHIGFKGIGLPLKVLSSLTGKSGPQARRVISKWFHSTAPAKSRRCALPSRSASTICLAAPISTTSFPSLREVVSATTPSPAALRAIPAFWRVP